MTAVRLETGATHYHYLHNVFCLYVISSQHRGCVVTAGSGNEEIRRTDVDCVAYLYAFKAMHLNHVLPTHTLIGRDMVYQVKSACLMDLLGLAGFHGARPRRLPRKAIEAAKSAAWLISGAGTTSGYLSSSPS